jgi:2-dehydro-3-deoxyphosphogluconate aldolase/(4S)-4-hydroxy-2-oxoglutarate aldolase
LSKEQVLAKIEQGGIVAVIRADGEDQALRITDACLQGGVTALELTFTIPAAHKIIEALAKRFAAENIVIGAGTVMDSETARISLLSGAEFVVSPYFDPETVALCNRYRVPVMPGVMTVGEAVRAMNAGADILKVFPADLFGPKIIRAIKGPIPQAKMVPTGGVSVDNVQEWFAAGVFAVGAGGSLTAGAETGDYQKITNTAKRFVEEIQAFKQKAQL